MPLLIVIARVGSPVKLTSCCGMVSSYSTVAAEARGTIISSYSMTDKIKKTPEFRRHYSACVLFFRFVIDGHASFAPLNFPAADEECSSPDASDRPE